LCKKEEDTENYVLGNEHELNESDLNSTSELEEELEGQYDQSKDSKEFRIKSAKFSNPNPFGWKSRRRSCKVTNSKKEKKAEKKMEKSIKVKKFFNDDSDVEKIDHQWDEMSISDDIFEKVEPQPDIYDNSKSYE
jgi:hypothetical protein